MRNFLEQQKLKLERDRLLFEKEQAKRTQPLSTDRLGPFITYAAAIAGVLISFTQIGVAIIQKNQELESKQIESDRAWGLAAAEFVAKNSDVIFGENRAKSDLIVDVIASAYPKTISDKLVKRVEQTSSYREYARDAAGGDLLYDFWKPDGKNINKANAAVILNWMKNNKLSTGPGDIVMFLRAREFDDLRRRATSELELLR